MAERYRRFSLSQRIEHWVQLVAFAALALTGLPQRYDGAWLSGHIIEALGGIEVVRIIHRVFATILMLAVVYHFTAVGWRKYVLREPRTMVPGRADLKAIGQSFSHVIGLRRQPPRQGRYTWEEKVEYWALIWGTVIMVITGFFLWNPIATTTILPGEFIPAARSAHSYEALLAVLAVLVWHMYHVHLRRFNRSIYGGYLTREEMEEEHPLELEAVERGDYARPSAAEIRHRARRFIPVAGVAVAVLLLGLYFFIGFENTAISTITPAAAIDEFVPDATTTTTAGGATSTTVGPTTTIPAGAPTWESAIGPIFGQRCTGCHGGSSPTSGLDLSTYQGILTGGASGPGIVPGDPDAGTVLAKMGGPHAASLTPEELGLVREWVAAGAPEAAGPTTTTTTTSASVGWAFFAAIFQERCLLCHAGSSPAGGLDLSSYAAARAGGVSGPGLVPGDPAASAIYRVMLARQHPLLLSPEEVELLRAWINAGALQG